MRDKLLQYERAVHFLSLLGFNNFITDSSGTKLICNNPPPNNFLQKVLDILYSKMKSTDGLQVDNTQNSVSMITEDFNDNTIEIEEDESALTTNENIRDNDTMETLILMHQTFSQSIPLEIDNDATKLQEFTQNVLIRVQLKSVKALRVWTKQ